MIRGAAFGAVLSLPGIVAADALELPRNATLRASVEESVVASTIPTGVWSDGVLPVQPVEGALTRQVWQIPATGLTSAQLARPLRRQLRDSGYEILLDCPALACGGFDFRFAIDVVPAPDMHVNLRDFHFVAAMRDAADGSVEAVTILTSRTARAGYLQIERIGPPQETPAIETNAPALRAEGAPVEGLPLEQALEENGGAVLHGLSFETGSAQLSAGPFAALDALAGYLAANPSVTVALVGHTDAEGSLDGNIALSKRRAGSVLERLVRDYGVPRNQLAAEGMGYLSPIASNQTDDGREANRRVEVIVTSTP